MVALAEEVFGPGYIWTGPDDWWEWTQGGTRQRPDVRRRLGEFLWAGRPYNAHRRAFMLAYVDDPWPSVRKAPVRSGSV